MANPEINRLWASRRINSLLKGADRTGDRGPVIPEIVRLGEDYSIATEYTSFLVLENDAEYQRWKISRKNLTSISRDRQVLAKRREQLDAIRNKALSDIGPQPATTQVTQKAPTQLADTSQAINRTVQGSLPQTTAQSRTDSRRQSSDFHIGGGSSPVGPIGVLLSVWLCRRKLRKS